MPLETISKYQSLITHSSDIITIVDDEGIIQFESPSIETILGYHPEDLIGEPALEYIHPDDQGRMTDSFTELHRLSPTDSVSLEYRFRHADGSWVWLESTFSNRTESALDGLVLNSRDITERKRREQELAEERDKYSAVVEQSQDGIAILQDGTFAFTNARGQEILGYSASELQDQPFTMVIAETDRELVRNRYEQRLDPTAETPPDRYEARFVRGDGEQRVGEVSVGLIQFNGRQSTLVTIRDVTDRKRREAQIRARTEQLEILNRIVRHDIRNDMSIIIGWSEILEEHVDDEGLAILEKILASGTHIVELTETVRDFVQTVISDDTVETNPIPLRSTVTNEVTLRAETYDDAEFSIPGQLPDVQVNANEMLGSVFRNLLNNAVQHNDSTTPEIEVTAEDHDDTVTVRIADNGPGVSDEQKDLIFGKGELGLDSEGTGIGLYLVQRLIDQYDGRVWVEDNTPRGAVFGIELQKV